MFVGTYSATEIEADDKYRLLGGNDGTVIANVSEAGTLKGTRCYFLFPSGSQPVNKSIGLGLPTAIHPNTYTEKQAKGVYTLQGIKINDTTNLPSGIYVRNGKSSLSSKFASMKQEYIHPKIQCITLTSELLDTVYSTSSGTSTSPSCARSPLHHHSEDNNDPEWD